MRPMHRLTAILLLTFAQSTMASPFISAGDSALRNDIQRLADFGVIKGPTSTWPLAWGPILTDLKAFEIDGSTPPVIVDALSRVLSRARWQAQSNELYFDARAAVAEKPTRLRSFEDTPRGRGELSLGAGYTGDWFAIEINAQALDVTDGAESFTADRSVIAGTIGNWSVGVNTLDRWWGPGWDSSLILSNNARPFPAISVDRMFTDAFDTKWLSWLGPWDLAVTFGQLESRRFVPDTQFFGLRFNFRPTPSLELGLSRAAQWCGDGRPCSLDTFVDLILGRDNVGDDGITRDTEPGNQLAGFDFRWTLNPFNMPMAVYGQFIGEDEAGGFPSRYLGQLGIEMTGYWRDRWSYRWYGEFAGTSCRFHGSEEIFNCAYNNAIYRTGYRYRGRSIGHSADNDARLLSAGFLAVDDNRQEWSATLRVGQLNRGGPVDPRNTVAESREDIVSLDVRYARPFSYGEVSVGLGFEQVDFDQTGRSQGDFRLFVGWRSSY